MGSAHVAQASSPASLRHRPGAHILTFFGLSAGSRKNSQPGRLRHWVRHKDSIGPSICAQTKSILRTGSTAAAIGKTQSIPGSALRR